MQLVIKPTYKCNFKCKFCSSINSNKDVHLTASFIIKHLKENNISEIIVNGGDPLMMPVDFYLKIIEYLNSCNSTISISLTTNLYDWYMNKNKWNALFHNKRINICTSFQYGDGRILPTGKPLDAGMFIDMQNEFFHEFKYHPPFISVITEYNDSTALQNIILAKKLGTKCKLNYAVASGRQVKMYSLDKIYSIYLKIIEENLYKYESNCLNIIDYFLNKHTICPLSNRTCQSEIQCINPFKKISACPALDDNGIYGQYDKFLFYKKECLTCKYFKLCNGCMKLVHDLKIENKYENCENLKLIYSKLESFILCHF